MSEALEHHVLDLAKNLLLVSFLIRSDVIEGQKQTRGLLPLDRSNRHEILDLL